MQTESQLRPKVRRNFWDQLQSGWRSRLHVYPDFVGYQSSLFEKGVKVCGSNQTAFASAFQAKDEYLKPKQISLTITVSDAGLNALRAYNAAVFGAHDKEEVAATFVRVGLDHQ